MKQISLIILLLPVYLQLMGQTPVNDTLMPVKPLNDTTLSEPKLQGGALIDTINIKNNNQYQPGYLNDTLKGKNKKDKPKGN